MTKRFLLFLVSLPWITFYCTPENEEFTTDPRAQLRFSVDTVLFDTVFTTVGSTTKRFRVFNDSKNAVNINRIGLGNLANSPYNVVVNGKEGFEFANERLLGEDSMVVLVEVSIDPGGQSLPFIVRDSLVFETNGNLQDIKLVAWGQDANFFRDSVLACNTVWTNEKPYVIFNSILVDSLCQLTIAKGSRVFSHNGSFIFVQGSLQVEGTVDEPVIFRNDRLDESFENAPGQWGGIIFLEGSKNNRIDHCSIRNAELGIRLGTPDNDTIPDLVISNSIIENMSNTGVLAFTSDLYAYNLLVDNCAINVVGNFAGGNYWYEHCTFANFSFDFFREDPAVVFSDNVVLADNTVLTAPLAVTLTNSIIWGNLTDELVLSDGGSSGFVFTVSNNILRSNIAELDINDNQLNQDPLFVDPQMFDYRLDTLSPAKHAGVVLSIINDLEGNMRDSTPDIGAYERIEN